MTNGIQAQGPRDADLPFRVSAVDIEPKDRAAFGRPVDGHASRRGAGRAPVPTIGLASASARSRPRRLCLGSTSRPANRACPSRHTFEATVELQLNMGRGYFSIETPIGNIRERRELGQGPQAVTSVHMAGFNGGTNLHPRVR